MLLSTKKQKRYKKVSRDCYELRIPSGAVSEETRASQAYRNKTHRGNMQSAGVSVRGKSACGGYSRRCNRGVENRQGQTQRLV